MARIQKGDLDVSDGLRTTLRVLRETRNDAAVGVLVPAIDSPHDNIRSAALETLLVSGVRSGQREVLGRLHELDEKARQILRRHGNRMTHTLRHAILDEDQQLCANSCLAALWFREYDLIPTLASAVENEENPRRELLTKTLLELAAELDSELTESEPSPRGRDPELIRRHIVAALERSVERFAKHRCREIIETFLRLATPDNALLRRALNTTYHAAHGELIDVLTNAEAASTIRLAISFLGESAASGAILSVIAKRSDLPFVRQLLSRTGHEISAEMARNLKRIQSIAWIEDGEVLDQLDAAAQQATVKLVMAAGIPKSRAFATVEHVLLHAQPAGRRAASEVLAQFTGAAANALCVRALDDDDAHVQAAIIGHLRSRGIPGLFPKLVALVDSPRAVVRKAVRENLSEFSFQRFLAAFDMLDEEVRVSTGELVKKVDPQTIPQLQAEMESGARTRRLRAVTIATIIGLTGPLELVIVELLEDTDHLVRAEAAKALVNCRSDASRDGLKQALADPSTTVRAAAEESLHQRGQAG